MYLFRTSIILIIIQLASTVTYSNKDFETSFSTVEEQTIMCELGNDCGADIQIESITNEGQLCVSACNTDVVSTGDCGSSTIWFEVLVDTDATGMLIDVTSEFTPQLILLESSCDGIVVLDCQEATTGKLVTVNPNELYYIGIGIGDGEQGDFDLCVETLPELTTCSTGEITITRPEFPNEDPNGPYFLGEVVEFCYSVQFVVDAAGEGNNCQWIQGIVPTIGTGWDLLARPIENQGPAGSDWFEDEVLYQTDFSIYGIESNCNGEPILSPAGTALSPGTLLPGGWYFVSPGATPLCTNTGNPNTGWGLPAACGSSQNVEFCFELEANNTQDTNEFMDPCFTDMDVSIFVFADGQTGCWSQNSCAGDSPTEFSDGSLVFLSTTLDNDGDGFPEAIDCDDSNPQINPDAIEVPNNNEDEDCDGEAMVIDSDGDGWNSDEDCDDTNNEINPAATEVPGNGIDEDCDGLDGPSAVQNIDGESLTIFPNPTSDKIYFDTDATELTYTIFNIQGEQKEIGQVQESVNLESFVSGIYLLRVTSVNGESVILRVVKL